jgi:hypothetical protein
MHKSFLDSKMGAKQGDQRSRLKFVNYLFHNINDDIDGLCTSNEIKLFILLFADDAVLFVH